MHAGMGEFPQWVMVGLGVAGFIVTIMVTTGTVVWQAGNVEIRLTAAITQHKERLDRELDALKADVAGRFTTAYVQIMQNIETTKATGAKEVADALDHIRQVEIFIRDEFVRKETFNMVVERILNEVRTIGSNLEARQLRLDGKLDRLLGIYARASGKSLETESG